MIRYGPGFIFPDAWAYGEPPEPEPERDDPWYGLDFEEALEVLSRAALTPAPREEPSDG